MSKKLLFSIIMPTLNSEKTIGYSLQSICSQNFDKDLVEILVIDGGSTDTTLDIAKKYGCKVISNPKVQQEYAKHLGIINAVGNFVLFLDSDEVLECKDALNNRLKAFKENTGVKVVQFGGYKRPADSSPINDYINIYGDPFAHFMYGISSDSRSFLNDWKHKFPLYDEKDYGVIFKYTDRDVFPVVDMCAGNTFDLDFFRENFSHLLTDPMVVPQLYYLLVNKTKTSCVLKNDSVIHNSSDSFGKFLKKLHWRVRVNVHYKNIPGTGFSNRENFSFGFLKFKKYLFPLYAFTLFVPLIDSLYNFLKYLKPVLLLHSFFTLYVGFSLVFEYSLLLLAKKPTLDAYGKVNRKLNL